MNNESNNNQNQVIPTNTNNNQQDNITPIVPITPVPIQKDEDIQTTNDNSNGNIINAIPNIPIQTGNGLVDTPNSSGNLPITPIPGLKDNANNNSSQSELKIDGSSPFDIGINNIIPSQINFIPTDTNTNSNPTDTNINPTSNDINSLSVSTDPNVTSVPVNDININPQPDINTPNNINISSDNIIPVTKYIIYILLFSIPIVNIVIMVKKIMHKDDINITNFAIAYLIIMVGAIVIFTFLGSVFGITQLIA